MIAVLVCLLPVVVLFAALGAADKRWPDRLNRRGRHLAGLPEHELQRQALSPTRPRDSRTAGGRGTPKTVLFALAVEQQRFR